MQKTQKGDGLIALAIVVGAVIIGGLLYLGLRDPEPPVGAPGSMTDPAPEIPSVYQGGAPETPPVEPPVGTESSVSTPPEPVMLSDEELIGEALVMKTGIPESEITYSVGESDGAIARGTVGRVGEMGGAGFFAAKVSGDWMITYVGQGVPACDEVNPYGYPTTWADYCIQGGSVVPR